METYIPKTLLDTISRPRFLSLIIFFLVSWVFMTVISFTSPQPFLQKDRYLVDCQENDDGYVIKNCAHETISGNNRYTWRNHQKFVPLNRFIVLEAVIFDEEHATGISDTDKKFEITFETNIWTEQNDRRRRLATDSTVYDSGNADRQLAVAGKDMLVDHKIETRHVTCKAGKIKCEDVELAIIIGLDEDVYYAEVSIADAERLDSLIGNIRFTWKYENEKWSVFIIVINYLYFCFACAALFAYIWRLRKVSAELWTFDQKMILALGVTWVFFNDPFFAITVVEPNGFSIVMGVFFTCFFLGTLMTFVLCTMDRIGSGKYHSVGAGIRFVPKVIFSWIAMVFYATVIIWMDIHLMEEPTANFEEDMPTGFKVMQAFQFVVIITFLIWLVYYAVQALKIVCQRGSISPRHKFLFWLTLVVCLFVVIGSITSVFQERPRDGSLYMFFLNIFMIYVFLLMVGYSPSETAILEAKNTGLFELDGIPLSGYDMPKSTDPEFLDGEEQRKV
mmetsp:Transcript_40475/g.46411  ORF Transcript_40475/g.46411 Transcript_40475/m.46411 type:complete len:505 (-) Transcript_40475:102-1616(-)